MEKKKKKQVGNLEKYSSGTFTIHRWRESAETQAKEPCHPTVRQLGEKGAATGILQQKTILET